MNPHETLVFMLINVNEQPDGTIHLWGRTRTRQTIFARVLDYEPYFYIPCPTSFPQSATSPKDDSSTARQQALGSEPDSNCELVANDLKRLLAQFVRGEGEIRKVECVKRKPIMFFRPDMELGGWWLKISIGVGNNTRKIAGIVKGAITDGKLTHHGYIWDNVILYEEEVKLLMRYLCDASLSGASWVSISSFTTVNDAQRCSTCDFEITTSWRSIESLTPDIVQIANTCKEDTETNAIKPHIDEDLAVSMNFAKQGAIPPIRMIALDLIIVPKDGMPRSVDAAKDPIVQIACEVSDSATKGRDHKRWIFVWGATEGYGFQCPGVQVVWCLDERSMLVAFRDWVRDTDPDGLVVFEVKNTLRSLQERCRVLGIEGGAFKISRFVHTKSTALKVKNIVMYSVAWVKSQARMASTSNQETWKAEVDGRMIFDVLRYVLTSCNLATFTLVDCVQSVLKERMEVLTPETLYGIWKTATRGQTTRRALFLDDDDARRASSLTKAWSAATRLSAYGLQRAKMIRRLMDQLGVFTEAVEMARVTGLTLVQVMYNAQMIRTWSLLLRHAHSQAYIIGGRHGPASLSESPYLMHPVLLKNVALYKEPVAVLDFASLYPSLYCGYNLCYTTLVHPDDVKTVGEQNVTVTPIGAAFIKSDIRKGLLPDLLMALMKGRAGTREAMKKSKDDVEKRILNGRQKALKTVANAMYGFTGAQASPLQCVPLADSCLALGASVCRRAREVIEDLASLGELGSSARGTRVIYAQTDSLFVHFPNASLSDAIGLGKLATKLVSAAFPAEINLKFENVLWPFMLLHVNRYAGCAYETERDVEERSGKLVVKGIKSMWRQAAPVVQQTLQGAVERIVMENDVLGAVSFVQAEVARLLSGDYGIWHFIMNGGLWRVTGSQIEKAAADEAGDQDEDVRGPHAALAVKIQQRDPNRKFALGERLQYVLLSGYRIQDDAAEDPVAALHAQLQPDFDLYWRNKLMRPLTEIFATCLDQTRLQNLLGGAHTRFHVSRIATPRSTPRRMRPGAGGGSSSRQTGLTNFFKQTARCLGCKKPIETKANAPSGELPPGLCQDCWNVQGKWEEVYLRHLGLFGNSQQRSTQALSACMNCHSGGMFGDVVCQNSECRVLYDRIESLRIVEEQGACLERLNVDW